MVKDILLCPALQKTMPTPAIYMGDGHVVQKCGDFEVDMPMGSTSIAHRLYVMDREAFDFVSGTDFFAEAPQILPLTLQWLYVLHPDHDLSPHKLHPVFHLKDGICVQRKDAQFPRVPT